MNFSIEELQKISDEEVKTLVESQKIICEDLRRKIFQLNIEMSKSLSDKIDIGNKVTNTRSKLSNNELYLERYSRELKSRKIIRTVCLNCLSDVYAKIKDIPETSIVYCESCGESVYIQMEA